MGRRVWLSDLSSCQMARNWLLVRLLVCAPLAWLRWCQCTGRRCIVTAPPLCAGQGVGPSHLPAAARLLLTLRCRVVRHQPAGNAGRGLRPPGTGAEGGVCSADCACSWRSWLQGIGESDAWVVRRQWHIRSATSPPVSLKNNPAGVEGRADQQAAVAVHDAPAGGRHAAQLPLCSLRGAGRGGRQALARTYAQHSRAS